MTTRDLVLVGLVTAKLDGMTTSADRIALINSFSGDDRLAAAKVVFNRMLEDCFWYGEEFFDGFIAEVSDLAHDKYNS